MVAVRMNPKDDTMLRTAYGFLIGTTMFTAFPGALIIQGGALVILGWAVWYLLARAIPAIMKSATDGRLLFLEAQDDMRREFHDSIAILAGSLNCLTAALIKDT